MVPIPRHFSKDQIIFREGELSKCMYLIKRGSVSIQRRRGDRKIELARVHMNEVLGELSFFDRKPRSATAVASNNVELLEITFDSLDKIWGAVPDYMKTIMASVAERLRKANEQIRKLQKGEFEIEEVDAVAGVSNEAGGAVNALSAVEALAEVDDEGSDGGESSEKN